MSPARIDPTFARDVAKQIDRRRLRRRLLVWTALLAIAVVAAMYLTCGHGFGLGGAGPGSGPGPGPGSVKALTGAKRCAIRVTAAGLTVDGKARPRDEVVTACAATDGADVIVTGDARQGEWKELEAALRAARVTNIVVHQ